MMDMRPWGYMYELMECDVIGVLFECGVCVYASWV